LGSILAILAIGWHYAEGGNINIRRRTILEHKHPVRGVTVFRQKQQVFSASYDEEGVVLVSPLKEKSRKKIETYTLRGMVNTLCATSKARALVAGGNLENWSLATIRRAKGGIDYNEIGAQGTIIKIVRMRNNPPVFGVITAANKIKFVSSKPWWRVSAEVELHSNSIQSATSSPKGRSLAVLTKRGKADGAILAEATRKVTVVNGAGTTVLEDEIKSEEAYQGAQLTFVGDTRLVMARGDGQLTVWDKKDGTWARIKKPFSIPKGHFSAIAALPRQSCIVLAGASIGKEAEIFIADLDQGRVVREYRIPMQGRKESEYASDPVQSLVSVPGQHALVVGLWDGRVIVLSLGASE